MIQTPTEIGAPYRGVLGLTQFGRVASVGWPLKRPRLAAGGKQIRTLGPPSPAQTVLRVSESDAVEREPAIDDQPRLADVCE